MRLLDVHLQRYSERIQIPGRSSVIPLTKIIGLKHEVPAQFPLRSRGVPEPVPRVEAPVVEGLRMNVGCKGEPPNMKTSLHLLPEPEARREHSIHKSEIASYSGSDQDMLRQVESGHSFESRCMFHKLIAAAFGCPAVQIANPHLQEFVAGDVRAVCRAFQPALEKGTGEDIHVDPEGSV